MSFVGAQQVEYKTRLCNYLAAPLRRPLSLCLVFKNPNSLEVPMHIITEKITLVPGAAVDLETGTVMTVKAGVEVEILGTLEAGAATALVIPTYANSGALPTPAAAIYGAIAFLTDQGTLCVCTSAGWKVMSLVGHTH
ncbi:MAG: hypothetical protein ACYCZF_03760 [Anaerolineae bacterium]